MATRLPKLKSEGDEDPLFDDDWEASVFLYPRSSEGEEKTFSRPPVTLLVMAVSSNIIFDPSAAELAVAEVVLAVSVGERSEGVVDVDMDGDGEGKKRDLRLLAVRTIDPPSRLTHPGVPNALNTATGGKEVEGGKREGWEGEGVWMPPRGGAKRGLIAGMIGRVLERGGVAEEVLDGLDGVELG